MKCSDEIYVMYGSNLSYDSMGHDKLLSFKFFNHIQTQNYYVTHMV